MPSADASADLTKTPGPSSTLEATGRGFLNSFNQFRAAAWGFVAKVADAADTNVARPLVHAENRIKVALLQAKQSGIDAGVKVADAADKALDTASTVVNRLKWVYIGLGVLVAIYFLAKAKEIFREVST